MAETLPVQLLVMAKAPVPGAVKTRLCPPLSYEQAALLARAALVDTIEACVGARFTRVVLVLDGEVGDWLRHDVVVLAQRPGDLASRLEAAVLDAWAVSSLPIFLIGMDTPQVTPTQLRGAADLLLAPGVDAVLGPAEDGGFWSIGVRAPHVALFRDVPMSVANTGAQQAARLTSLGLRWAALETLRDVDLVSDIALVTRLSPDGEFSRAAATLGVGEPLAGVGAHPGGGTDANAGAHVSADADAEAEAQLC